MPRTPMSHTIESLNDLPSDESMLDSFAATAAAELPTNDGDKIAEEIAEAAEWTGPRCEKCDAPQAAEIVNICRRCGWYASLGTFVEVDPDWESEPASGVLAAESAARPDHLQVWLKLIPRWGWIMIASALAVVAESVVARFLAPGDGWLRTAWSLGQLAIGFLAAVSCHVFNFLVLATDDAEFGVLDLILKPLKLWLRAIERLPERLWVANSAQCGVVAMVMSIVVIGGIPYERVWDWGFKQPPKQNLKGAVMNQINKMDNGKQSDSLEGAINDFAGDKGDKKDDKQKPDAPKPRENAECVILGYRLDRAGRLESLLLGTASDQGQLVYTGSVTPKLDEPGLRRLAAMLQSIRIQKPIVRIELDANWVQPKFTCSVSYGKRSSEGRLHDIEWDRMVGSLQLK